MKATESGEGLNMALALRSPNESAYSRTRDTDSVGEISPLQACLARLHTCSLRQNFVKNSTIFAEGDAADRVYKVVHGVVRICKHTADGRRHIVDFALAGELFGIVEDSQHELTAEAVNDAVLVSYPRSRIDQLGAEDPNVGRHLLAHLYGNLITMQRHLLVLGCQDAKERLAWFLLRLAKRTGVACGGMLDLAMGRQDIADHLGLTIETICRTIRDLKNDGTVSVPSIHQLVLADMRTLRTLAISN
jgi:CRP/FNR family transcriptional regulator, nitrogen fixation regulation protein